MQAVKTKKLNAYFDKLTILGDLKNDVHIDRFKETIESIGFIKQEYDSRNYGFKEIYKHETFGYIEFADKNHKQPDQVRLKDKLFTIERERELIRNNGPVDFLPSLDELNSAYEETTELIQQCDERGFLKRMKDVRYEFNPKYGLFGDAMEENADIQRTVLEQMTNKHCTQIHVAMDYSLPIQKMFFIDKKARTECIFRDKNKQNETVYLGDRSSREYLCIYDKKAENAAKGTMDQYPDVKEVVRFEARLKGSKIDDFTENGLNPFKDLRAYTYAGHDLESLDDEEEMFIVWFLFKVKKGMDPFGNMNKYKKKKYRELLDSTLKTIVDPYKDLDKEKGRLVGELIDLMNRK